MQINKIYSSNFCTNSFKRQDNKKTNTETSNLKIEDETVENQEKKPIKAELVFLKTPEFYVAKYEDGTKRKYTLDGKILQAETSNGHRYDVDLNNVSHKEENEKYEKLTNERIEELYDNGEYEQKLMDRLNLICSMVSAKKSGDTKTFNELCDSLKDKKTGRYNLSIEG